ncbi:MAG: hypothetical protein ACLSCV_02185 [Acutalibacteraceae bacterium]
MAKGTTVKMWRRTLIVLIVMVALGFGLIVVSLIRLQLVDGAELQKAVRPAIKRYNHSASAAQFMIEI